MMIEPIMRNLRIKTFAYTVLASVCLTSCCNSQETPTDTKHLEEFHRVNFGSNEKPLKEGQRNLYVDYSTCCALGQNSKFFQDVSASFVDPSTNYYAIQGSEITKMSGDIYTLLRNIHEVNYAELEKAANNMAQSDVESILLTDGEYYTPSIAKGHDNDPYLSSAFKTCILKGHDIHIISEPYVEPYNGALYNKKRFYILFTDDRMRNNIYNRIRRTVDFTKYPDVEEFHISASHPRLGGNGNNSSVQNKILQSKSKGFGSFEIEDWDGCDWKTIEETLVNAVDENTGEPLNEGATIIEMGLDKNSFGCYRIKSLGVKCYVINKEYNDFYLAKENGEKVNVTEEIQQTLESFMLINKEEFDKHSKICISFNPDWFNPDELSGKPYNYLKIDLIVNGVQERFSSHEDKFIFESISQPGSKNISIASSIKQCLADDDVIGKILGQVIYSIYIKSEQQ